MRTVVENVRPEDGAVGDDHFHILDTSNAGYEQRPLDNVTSGIADTDAITDAERAPDRSMSKSSHASTNIR